MSAAAAAASAVVGAASAATAASARSTVAALRLRGAIRDMRRGDIGLQVPRPPKGATRDAAARAERVLKIQANIAPGVQAKKLADYRKTLPPKPRSGGLLQYVKKNAVRRGAGVASDARGTLRGT